MPLPDFPPSWAEALTSVRLAPAFEALSRFVDEERALAEVYPPADLVFAALERTPLPDVRVVLVGQDPYHGPGQAHGLALSVPSGVKPPPSLANMFKELASDLGVPRPTTGSLLPWAEQGVLLLNVCLTVRARSAGSHQGKGWEAVTDAVLSAVSARDVPAVFVLWGAAARKKARLVGAPHRVIEGVHPSPLSAHGGFFGSRPYSRINEALVELGHAPIDFRLP